MTIIGDSNAFRDAFNCLNQLEISNEFNKQTKNIVYN